MTLQNGPEPSRRRFLQGIGASAALGSSALAADDTPVVRIGRIKQVIAAWPFAKGAGWSQTDLIKHAKALGVAGVELFSADELAQLKGTGLVCGATRTHSFVRGMNNKGHHPEVFAALEKALFPEGFDDDDEALASVVRGK